MIHFVSTKAKPGKCRRCRAAILTALDEGLPARVDAAPLRDHQAELAALLEGRWTYIRHEYGYLIHRDATRIAGGTIRGSIHAEHKCVTHKQLEIDGIGA